MHTYAHTLSYGNNEKKTGKKIFNTKEGTKYINIFFKHIARHKNQYRDLLGQI